MIKVGDEVVLVRRGKLVCEHGVKFFGKTGEPVKPGTVVVEISEKGISAKSGKLRKSCCPNLILSDGTRGHYSRYRKVTRDTGAADAEFTALIKGKKYVKA